MADEIDRIGIVGGGAWGTALALAARRAGRDVILWAREPEVVTEINAQHRNTPFLQGIALDPGIKAVATFEPLAECDAILMVTPAQAVRAIGQLLAQLLPRQCRLSFAPRASRPRPAC